MASAGQHHVHDEGSLRRRRGFLGILFRRLYRQHLPLSGVPKLEILHVLKLQGDDNMKKIIGEAMYKARQAEIAQGCLGLLLVFWRPSLFNRAKEFWQGLCGALSSLCTFDFKETLLSMVRISLRMQLLHRLSLSSAPRALRPYRA